MKNILAVLFILLLTACADRAPIAEGYRGLPRTDTDPTVYTIRGEVVAELRSATSVGASGSGYYGQYGGSSSFHLWQEGKGFLRLKIESISPATDLAKAGDVVILKTEDRKMIALLAGDKLIMKCRVQYEVLTSVLGGRDIHG